MDGKANSRTQVEEACLVRLNEVFRAELKALFHTSETFISTLSLDIFSFFILHYVNNLLRKYPFVPHNFVVRSVTVCTDLKVLYLL